MKRILVDMDEVLASLFPKWLQRVEELSGYKIDPGALKSWHIHKYIPFLPEEEVYKILEEENLYANLEPVEGAIEGLRYLNDNYEVVIVTAPTFEAHYAYRDKIFWLRENTPFIDISKQFVVTQNKTLVAREGDLLVDDGSHNCIAHDEIGGISICLSYPHNEEYNGIRVNSWEEILQKVKEIVNA